VTADSLVSRRVGFVGAGSMGGPMVHRLLRAGVPVTVFVRRAAAAEEFEEAGAAVSRSLVDVAHGNDVVICCLFDEHQLEDAVLGAEGVAAHLGQDSQLVIHTTASPDIMKRIETAADERGAHLLDAPISGTADDIEAGMLTVLAGGDPATVADLERIMRTYAGQYLPTGPVGTASTIKLVNNLLFTANVQLVAAAVDMGGSLGVEPATLMSTISKCSGSSYAMARMSTDPTVGQFANRVGKYLSKDARAAIALAEALGAPCSLLRHVADEGPLDLNVECRGDRHQGRSA
jgi:3-hydroxyisobutyrate dehydrogenase-like beta-hydroxyacid dehydrogenase